KRWWSKFWGLRWRVKGPILAVVAVIIIGVASGGGDDDEPVTQASDDDTPAATRAPSNTPKPSNTPQPSNTPPPTATPQPPGYSFGSGAKRAGTDFVAATYRTREKPSQSCYWERLSGFGGTFGEIITNDNTDGPAVVT